MSDSCTQQAKPHFNSKVAAAWKEPFEPGNSFSLLPGPTKLVLLSKDENFVQLKKSDFHTEVKTSN